MPRPGPRPYECIRRAWHSDSHQPLRGALIKEIFRVVNEIHNPHTRRNKEWQEKLPVVVFRAEEILYSKANSENEYADMKTLRSRLDDAVNTMIRREETEEDGIFLAPCIEAALSLGCTPKKIPRGQKAGVTRYLSSSLKRNDSSAPGSCRSFSAGSGRAECLLAPAHDRKQCQNSRPMLVPSLEQVPCASLPSIPGSVNAPISTACLPHSPLVSPQYNPARVPDQTIFFQVPQASSCPPLPEPGSLVQFLRSADVGRPICFPRCDVPLVPLSPTTPQALYNVSIEPRSVLNNGMCARKDQFVCKDKVFVSTASAQIPCISRPLEEAGFPEPGNPSHNSMVGLKSGFSVQNCQSLQRQETSFNPNTQAFSGVRDVGHHVPVVSQVALSTRRLPTPIYPNEVTPKPSNAYSSSMPSSTSVSLVDSVGQSKAHSDVYDLQLRLGPPGAESCCLGTQPFCTIQTIVSHRTNSVVGPTRSACIERPSISTPDIASSSKRLRFSLKNFDAPVSMQYSAAPYPSFPSYAHLRG